MSPHNASGLTRAKSRIAVFATHDGYSPQVRSHDTTPPRGRVPTTAQHINTTARRASPGPNARNLAPNSSATSPIWRRAVKFTPLGFDLTPCGQSRSGGEARGQHLGQVDRPAVGALGDLGSAAEAVRAARASPGAASRTAGSSALLRQGLGHLVVLALEAEVAGQAAAARRAGVRPPRPPSPAARSSASKPSVACWWQWTWVIAVAGHRRWRPARERASPGSRRGCGSGRPASRARGSPVRSGTSPRSADRQLGSRPTTGVPAASSGASTRRLRRITRRATHSWPVDTHVSPQHTAPLGSIGFEAGRAQHAYRGAADLRGEVVRERVRPQHHAAGRSRNPARPPGERHAARPRAASAPARCRPGA